MCQNRFVSEQKGVRILCLDHFVSESFCVRTKRCQNHRKEPYESSLIVSSQARSEEKEIYLTQVPVVNKQLQKVARFCE